MADLADLLAKLRAEAFRPTREAVEEHLADEEVTAADAAAVEAALYVEMRDALRIALYTGKLTVSLGGGAIQYTYSSQADMVRRLTELDGLISPPSGGQRVTKILPHTSKGLYP